MATVSWPAEELSKRQRDRLARRLTGKNSVGHDVGKVIAAPAGGQPERMRIDTESAEYGVNRSRRRVSRDNQCVLKGHCWQSRGVSQTLVKIEVIRIVLHAKRIRLERSGLWFVPVA